MTITRQFIQLGASDAGGWTKEQLTLLGVAWPPVKEWPSLIIGTELDDSVANRFVAMRGRKGPLRCAPMNDLFSFPHEATRIVRVEFDGGTPCNIPRIGYGIGYGSYRIDAGPIVRLDHGHPMSANAAELLTLVRALEDVSRQHAPGNVAVAIHGDSQTALGRCHKPIKAKDRARARKSAHFYAACDALLALCRGFARVETHWRGRAASVRLFGH